MRNPGPVEPRLLGEPAVRRSIAASAAIGVISAASVVVQALALAGLLAGAMSRTDEDPLPAVLWLAGAFTVRGLCALLAEVVVGHGAEAAKAQLRGRLLRAALSQAAGGGGMGGGDVAALAGRGLDALDAYIGRCLPDLVLAATVPIALVVVVGALDWPSALIVLTVLALFPVFGILVGESGGRLAARRWGQVEAFGRQIADVFEGLPTLKAFGRSVRQRARIAEAAEGLRQASLSTLRVAFLSALVLDTLASVSVALVAVPLGLRLLTGSVRLAPALAVLIVAPEVFLPIRRASAQFHESAEGLAAARRAMDVIQGGATAGGRSRGRSRAARHPGQEQGQGPVARPEALPPGDPARVAVALSDVRFERSGRAEPVLDGASLTIQPGEKVVLIGPNGAGKSTILSLLLGFAEPARGSVTVGGVDLRDLDGEAWRRWISYLPERPTLLAGSLADNLRLADPTAGDARLVEVLDRMSGAGLLASLEGGLAARLGEGGRQISAGERQRIALARALLRPASLHLLDEPTAHLDDHTEAAVLEALRGALAGCSALIVTHRPAVIDLADRVITLDAGRCQVADGPATAGQSGARAGAGAGTPRAAAVDLQHPGPRA